MILSVYPRSPASEATPRPGAHPSEMSCLLKAVIRQV